MKIVAHAEGAIVTQVHPLDSSKTNSIIYPCEPQELIGWLSEDKSSRKLVQNQFPHFSAEQREFLLTGFTDEVWDLVFPSE